MQRAVDKTENMKARADAVSELEAAGTFDDITALGSGEDDIDRQLKQLSSQPAVDDELAKMKSEIGSRRRGTAAQIPAQSRRRRGARRPTDAQQAPAAGRPDMIVRISGEDQYELADEDYDRLNELENAVVAVVEGGDEDGFADDLRRAARLRARERHARRRRRARRLAT